MGPRADDTNAGAGRPGAWSPPGGPPAEQPSTVQPSTVQPVTVQPVTDQPVAATTLVDLNAPIEPVTPTVRPIDQRAISLPAAQPRPSARLEPTSAPLSYLQEPAAPVRRARKQRRPGRALVVLLLLGGLGTAGVVYGPDLYDQYVAEAEPPEPSAPRAFPIVRPGGAEARTATFEIDGLSTGSTATYTITVDFETWVSRVVIDRPDGDPDLEVLTFSDDALVRRLDSESWFQIDRGSFPFDDQLQRTDWIRAVDDLLPTDQRSGILIEDATEAEVGGVDTRHLVLRLDPSAIAVPQPVPMDPMDPIADITSAAGSETPATVTPTTVTPTTVTPTTVAPDETAELDTIELWVDDRGMIRRSAGAGVLGVQDATILDVSESAWIPEYPDVSQISPMTAGALLELGL